MKNTTILIPEKNTIPYNCTDGYKEQVTVDSCLKEEILDLWNIGIITTGCCCGHGGIGFIQVIDDCIDKMKNLEYEQYIYDDMFGGKERRDAFIPKSKCECEVLNDKE